MNCGTRTDPDITEVYAVTVMCGRDEKKADRRGTTVRALTPILLTCVQ